MGKPSPILSTILSIFREIVYRNPQLWNAIEIEREVIFAQLSKIGRRAECTNMLDEEVVLIASNEVALGVDVVGSDVFLFIIFLIIVPLNLEQFHLRLCLDQRKPLINKKIHYLLIYSFRFLSFLQ